MGLRAHAVHRCLAVSLLSWIPRVGTKDRPQLCMIEKQWCCWLPAHRQLHWTQHARRSNERRPSRHLAQTPRAFSPTKMPSAPTRLAPLDKRLGHVMVFSRRDVVHRIPPHYMTCQVSRACLLAGAGQHSMDRWKMQAYPDAARDGVTAAPPYNVTHGHNSSFV